MQTDCEIVGIQKEKNHFIVDASDGSEFIAERVIIATGGCSAPDLGSNGSGYKLLSDLGHSVVPIFPSLVQLKSSSTIPNSLNGIKFNGSASIVLDSEVLQTEYGEILFRTYGFSGPCILQLSRKVGEHLERVKNGSTEKLYLSLDILPDFTEKELLTLLLRRIHESKDKLFEHFLIGLLNKKLGQVLLKDSGVVPLSRPVSSMTKPEIHNIIRTIKNWSFEIIGTMPWNSAQVTAGGIMVDDFSNETLESKLVKGLYATGELLDIDGDCGGYNLQWAWASGNIAGTSAALSL